MLRGKKILLGVCGSIAAYKSALLIRLLVKSGAEVKVVMTSSALDFITPLTLSTLSKNPVLSEFSNSETGDWNNHVELGLWADLILIAPISANTLAKFANGVCDNLLSAVYLSARCPVLLAPAMDLDMYKHPATLNNVERLKGFGNEIIAAEHGELASGLIGQGRMVEPEQIIEFLQSYTKLSGPFNGKKVLITAGPTFEAIDPVRFIGNHSSGKMGYAIAEQAANMGADVTLVSGPTNMNLDHPMVNIVSVVSAVEMFDTCVNEYKNTDISILAAAVADYRSENVSDQKIKKSDETMTLSLIKNPDIAYELGQLKTGNQFNVGFALETENERDNAKAKLEKKNLDMIVLNTLRDEGAGFSSDKNKVTILDSNNTAMDFELKDKMDVAKDILQAIIARYEN